MKFLTKVSALLAGAGLFITLSGPAMAQKTDDATNFNGTAKNSDLRFARQAAMGGMEEVQLGRLAVQRAANEKVRAFGQRMIDDHTRANDQLKAVAAKDNITLPGEIGPKQTALMDRLSRLTGPEFDRAYMRDMVKDHEKDLADFQNEAANGRNPDLKAWASMTIPMLQEHLQLAKDAQNAAGVISRK